MHPYRNLSGNSGVVAYEIAATSITIEFQDGGIYLYDYMVPGPEAVEAMKKLAKAGAGLATYINTHVRDAYERKIA